MGTPEFALPSLQKLIDSEHNIVGVVTQPDRPKGRGRELTPPPVKQLAESAGRVVLQPESANQPEVIERLREMNPDLIVVVAFGQILGDDIISLPRHFCMNLHSSLLPKYRGAAPINWAIINGDKETGVSTMKVVKKLDAGDILLSRTIPIKDEDDAQTLHDTLAVEGARLVMETIGKLEKGTLAPIAQDSSLATYAAKLKKTDGLIRWHRQAHQIHNQIRGLEPWPGAYTYYKSHRLRVCRSEVSPGNAGDRPGTILRVSEFGLEVGTGKDRLIITKLQPEGKKRMTAKSYLAGHKVATGETFDPRFPQAHQQQHSSQNYRS